ncbi:MAG TPA: glycosyltransferase family 1 protein, partial [Candidatus Brocadiales bacterium]|nr:glycosyltransferase family 1 protein [Candidatus Brocadiales bacterium]
NIFQLPDERVRVIHSGANTLGINASSGVIKEKDDYILYIGRINEMKNLIALLRAFSIIHKKINHNLLIISDDKSALDREIKASNIDKYVVKKIIFKKNLTDKEKYCVMKKAAMLVFPSLYEGFGLPPIEAMACGCPVIVSNTSSIPEVCGDAAIYIDPYNHNSIADGIIELIENRKLRERLIDLGLVRACEFNWELSAREHLRVFENVLAHGNLPVETGCNLIPVLKNTSHSGLIR